MTLSARGSTNSVGWGSGTSNPRFPTPPDLHDFPGFGFSKKWAVRCPFFLYISPFDGGNSLTCCLPETFRNLTQSEEVSQPKRHDGHMSGQQKKILSSSQLCFSILCAGHPICILFSSNYLLTTPHSEYIFSNVLAKRLFSCKFLSWSTLYLRIRVPFRGVSCSENARIRDGTGGLRGFVLMLGRGPQKQ